MKNALKQDGEVGLTSHIAGEEASLLYWAVMVYPTWNKKGSDSGAPYAGPCVSQGKVRSASALTPQLGRAVSQHPCDCEIGGSPVGTESEQEAEEPTGAVPMALLARRDKPGCPASTLRWENPNSPLSSWQGTPAGSALTGQANPEPGAHLGASTSCPWPWEGHRAPGPHTGGEQPPPTARPSEHDRAPSWGRQCNHQPKGNTFLQCHNDPHGHD